MKKTFIILTIITLVSCKQTPPKKIEKQSFSISGTINGKYSGFIYLNYGQSKDSVKVKNNSFRFDGIVKNPIQGWLNLELDSNVAWLYVENSNIIVETNYEKGIQNGKPFNILKIKDIKGSHSADIQKEYKEFYQANQDKDNFKSLLYTKLKDFIAKNKKHPFSGTILGEIALINPILTKKELLQLYSKIDTTYQNKDDLEMFKMGIANLDEYGVGKSLLEFKLPNENNEQIAIKSILSKTTLVDFWASWCKPCRAKHPYLVDLKNKIDKDNFDIVSISIDEKKSDWIKAIEKDNLGWTNLLDINKEVSDKLGIQAIPFNYLIDENGIILGVNLSIEEIENVINEITSI
ncbi:AhpC/TSA family protein [Flavobacteriaceae bacterium XHP0103]|uniref:TlpA disulfide reductase family protein n=1 Tax=Marixanthotalea marina TaxID=2844359 RepID=UPI002989B3B9|nr:TlpA disulfide reductase family protein [Marixanthotalea marina]MBU3820825.1 AhpC/TSA family protein [Marixanthotalea marina]